MNFIPQCRNSGAFLGFDFNGLPHPLLHTHTIDHNRLRNWDWKRPIQPVINFAHSSFWRMVRWEGGGKGEGQVLLAAPCPSTLCFWMSLKVRPHRQWRSLEVCCSGDHTSMAGLDLKGIAGNFYHLSYPVEWMNWPFKTFQSCLWQNCIGLFSKNSSRAADLALPQ